MILNVITLGMRTSHPAVISRAVHPLPYLQWCVCQIRTPFTRLTWLPSPISQATHPAPNSYSLHSSWRSAHLSHISNGASTKFILPSLVSLGSPPPYLTQHIWRQIRTPFIRPNAQLPSPISLMVRPPNSYSLHPSHLAPLSHISSNTSGTKFILPSFVLALSSPLPYLQWCVRQSHTPFARLTWLTSNCLYS
jgi:hypothetical protein